jgi:tetratricopeptide (TPR) repeat protein
VSLALAHKRRLIASGPAAAGASAAAVAYTADTALASPANAQKHLKLMEVALEQDLIRISDIDSRELRQVLKRTELLPKYLDYVRRYRESGQNHPNPVMMQVLVWLIDVGQISEFLELADFAIEQGQVLPERFKRNVQTFVADEFINWADSEYKAKRSPEPFLSDLLPRVDGEWQLFERIPARFHRLLGLMAMDREDWAAAIASFERATKLYPEIRVETRLDAARKALKKQLAAEQASE